MTEPTTSAGSVLLLKKLIALFLPVAASLLAFWLGLRFVPIRKGHEREDMVDRVMGCLFSSCIIGITSLVLLYHRWPEVFNSAGKLAQAASLPHAAGFFAMTASVLIVCAIPGPWIVAGAFLWLEKRKGKDLGQILKDLRKDVDAVRFGSSSPISSTQDSQQDVQQDLPQEKNIKDYSND